MSEVRVGTPVYEGERYEAEVPDTLDLAERASLAISSLTQLLNPQMDFVGYHRLRLYANPPIMVQSDYQTNCEVKIVEALPLLRTMSGSDFNDEVDVGAMRTFVSQIGADGLYYLKHMRYPERDRPWPRLGPHLYSSTDEDFASIYAQGRFIRAMLIWHQLDDDPVWLERIGGVAAGLGKIAIRSSSARGPASWMEATSGMGENAAGRREYAFFPDGRIGEAFSYPRSGWKFIREPRTERAGEEGSMFMSIGGPIRALARWYGMSGDERALQLADGLVNFVLQPRFWEDVEHAQFGREAHLHAHLVMLWTLLEYAQVTGKEWLKDFVRFGYEHARTLGIPRIGCLNWTTEACAGSDMLALAVKLSTYGIGDYWDDVDAYIRNQMSEQQLIRRDLLEEVVGQGPVWEPDPPQVISEGVLDRAIGSFATNACPTRVYASWTICCPVNGAEALYYAWEGIVRCEDGVAQVNLLLNRASPWVDVDSYLPYEGRVEMRNKAARKLRVRVPRWVGPGVVRWRVNGDVVSAEREGRYGVVEGLKPGDEVRMEFPVVGEVARYRIEGSIEGSRWESKEYRCEFRGSTLVDIWPRDETLERDHRYIGDPTAYGTIPIYLRDHLKRDQAPMKRVTRFVSPRVLAW